MSKLTDILKTTNAGKRLIEKRLHNENDRPQLSKEERNAFMEAVANYHKIGDAIYRAGKFKEVAEQVRDIVEKAEAVTIQESEHWFDNMTVSRHMKQMNEAFKVFEKPAGEMQSMQQRFEAAYEDIGQILNKYYRVNEALSEEQYTVGIDDNDVTDNN